MSTPHIARKRFGQNFLIDHSIIDAIVQAIAPQAQDLIVEIGPGLAALTQAVLGSLPQQARPLHAVEIDRDLIRHLRQQFSAEQVVIHEGDALKFDFGALTQPGRRLRLIGNLPYNISSPLLFHLVQYTPLVTDQHFMLQKEVVERMVAEPGSSAFGRLSVMLQYRYALEWVLDVPPEAFDPAPKVQSAVVRMQPRPEQALQARDPELLARIVTDGFSQRRKMLRNTLKPWLEYTGGESAGMTLDARAEDISVEQWVKFSNAVAETQTQTSTGTHPTA
jgi:16S rRNA (adenine1518-N6/adenine1519-N6)-dimethyltransferase